MTPAVEQLSLSLALSNFSARWRGCAGLRSDRRMNLPAGTLAGSGPAQPRPRRRMKIKGLLFRSEIKSYQESTYANKN